MIRNRARRRLRALAREVLPDHGHPGWDYVLVGRPGATVTRDFAALRADLVRALGRVHDPAPLRGDGPRPDRAAQTSDPPPNDHGAAPP